MKLLLAGASGLVGGHVLAQADARGWEPVLIGRRPLGTGHDEIITDFQSMPGLPHADVAICALGTTIARAGSRTAFYAVDHDAVLAFAEAALSAKVRHFLIVTAVGADPGAAVFYSRVKGETERDLEALGFSCLDIAQPGTLLGARTERRPVELVLKAIDPITRRFMLGSLGRYAGIEAATVATALLALGEDRNRTGVFRHTNRALNGVAQAD